MDIKDQLKQGKNLSDLPLKVTFYARVSTVHELQATSIVNQIDFFKNYIKQHKNWIPIEGYVDEGISGKSVKKRENFLRMIKDAKKNMFHLILTKSVSRFARNTIDSIYYTDILSNYNIGVFFLNDNINTFYSDSEFRLTLMASIAQDELRKLSESVQFGLNQSIRRGVVLGNNNILGYKKKCGKLIIIEKEAQLVREIFNEFAKKKYNYLSLSKKIKNKYHINIDSKRIKRILTNYKYKGYYCGMKSKVINYKQNKRREISKDNWILYKDYDTVPPIIDEKTWNKVNRIIEEKNKNNPYNNKVYCIIHKKYLTLKRKKYKDKFYYYLICPHCINIKLSLIDRIFQINKYQKILIDSSKSKDIILKCKK